MASDQEVISPYQRWLKAVELRAQGLTFSQIGKAMGISRSAASGLLWRGQPPLESLKGRAFRDPKVREVAQARSREALQQPRYRREAARRTKALWATPEYRNKQMASRARNKEDVPTT